MIGPRGLGQMAELLVAHAFGAQRLAEPFGPLPDLAALWVDGPGVIGRSRKASKLRLPRYRRNEMQELNAQRKAEQAKTSHDFSHTLFRGPGGFLI